MIHLFSCDFYFFHVIKFIWTSLSMNRLFGHVISHDFWLSTRFICFRMRLSEIHLCSTWFVFTGFFFNMIHFHTWFPHTIHLRSHIIFHGSFLFMRFVYTIFSPHVLIFQVITYCCECSSSDGVNNLSAPPWLHQWTKRPQWRPPLIWHSDSIL